MAEVLIVAAFLSFLAYREWSYSKMLSDLQRKLMAKDLNEYRSISSVDKEQPKKPEKPSSTQFIDPFDVDPRKHFNGEYKPQSMRDRVLSRIGVKK